MPKISRALAIGVFGVVVILWLITPLVMNWIVGVDWPTRGQAGDVYGSVNALFSGLAFAGVVIAILLQREELALQREELRLTRGEMKKAADAQNEAQLALNKSIYAQSLRVALDILEDPSVVEARGMLINYARDLKGPRERWTDNAINSAQKVARTFDSVGIMIRKGLLPEDYLIDTWSPLIVRNWDILEDYLKILRVERQDPFMGKDFESLFHSAKSFLEKHSTTQQS